MRIPQPVKELISADQVVLVATTDKNGTPHMASAKGIALIGDDRVAFENWFCYRTLENIEENPKIALSLLKGERGIQIIGVVEKTVATEMLDGYSTKPEHRNPFPQTKQRIQIKVDKILELSTGPHSD